MNPTTEALQETTSFGTFKPVGHVLLGLPPTADRAAMIQALHDSGVADDALKAFAPRETVSEMQAMLEDASGLAGFGFEITLMRRMLKLSCEGYRWLLVKVDDSVEAQHIVDVAQPHGAAVAWYYRLLIVEELL